jgi:DNA-binding response OmpR family regulator
MKSRFFANISHELRTPLTLIMGPLENVLRRNQQENKDRKLLNLIQQNSRLLLKRINEFLDLSKLDAAKVKVENEPVQVYGFLKNVISEFENGAGIKNIPVNFASGLNAETIVLADGDKLEKIVSNFLSNAVKFTPANGAINIGLEKVDNMLQISVADTGPGIPAHEIQKIFDRFYKSPHHRQAGGTGIGLAMCREFAQLMKGKVWAESELGEGSIFYLQIPYEEMAGNISETTETPEENQIPKGELFATSNKGETILVVEDNPDLQEYLKVVLENFRVLTAENGKVALEVLTKNPDISLIISDIMMPVMDGLSLLKNLKQSDAYCHIPVIMLTARQNMETRIEALRIGVDDYVVKPFREAELNARVANLLAHRNSREEVSPGNDQDLKEDVPPQTLSPDDVKWLASVEKIVLENVEDSQFNISQLADEMDLGIRRFQQKIKAITGLTPKEYQREIQLEQARRLLESGDYQTMSEVSYRVGFKDAHYFSGLYYKRFGKKPSEYL